MAKPQVTEDDLKAGVGGLGGFAGLTSQAPRRDSPFGSDHVKRAPQDPPPVVESQPSSATGRAAHAVAAAVIPSQVQQPDSAIQAPPARDEVQAVQSPKPRPEKSTVKPAAEADSISLPREEGFTERVTLPISPEMRDGLHLLATKLQRRKTDKSERITSNTLMRVAIRLLLDELTPSEGDAPNTEEELYGVVRAKLKK